MQINFERIRCVMSDNHLQNKIEKKSVKNKENIYIGKKTLVPKTR